MATYEGYVNGPNKKGNNYFTGDPSQKLSVEYGLLCLSLLERKPGTKVQEFVIPGKLESCYKVASATLCSTMGFL